jgi:hypothetical protein
MKTNLILATILTASLASAQVTISDGTKIRVRLEQNLSSDSAEQGQTVDFAVTQEVRVGDAIVVANGARATGTIVKAEEKRRLGRAGHLDFTIDRVQLVDGNWLSVRYTPQKNNGKSDGIKTGLITAGVAAVFWPAAPLVLLHHGKDATIIKGRIYEVFSDESTYVASAIAASTPAMTRALPQAPATMVRMADGSPVNNGGLPRSVNTSANPMLVSNTSMLGGTPPQYQAGSEMQVATLNVTSSYAGADIEVDGMFVGSAPSTIQMTPGMHQLTVRHGAAVWTKQIAITGGQVSINATFTHPATQQRAAQ